MSQKLLAYSLALGAALAISLYPAEAQAAKRKKGCHLSEKQVQAGMHCGSAKFIPGSEETRSERDRRLKRECKGRPNSGVCLGYAY